MSTVQSYVLPSQEQTSIEPLALSNLPGWLSDARFDGEIIDDAINEYVDVADTECVWFLDQLYKCWCKHQAKKASDYEREAITRNYQAVTRLIDQIEESKLLAIDRADPACRYCVGIIDSQGNTKDVGVAATSNEEARMLATLEHDAVHILYVCAPTVSIDIDELETAIA